jgi:hypothetical protein
MTEERQRTRQERREARLRKKRERMPQHGRNLAKVYVDAVRKRLRHLRKDKPVE